MPDEPTAEEIFESDVRKELEKWNVLGLNPDNVVPGGGPVGIASRIEAVINVLLEDEILDEEKLNEVFRETFLRNLKAARESLEPMVHQAKLNAIKNGGLGKGGLFN